jgi:hypothetical protein
VKAAILLGVTSAALAVAAPAEAAVTFGSDLEGSTNFGLGCAATPPAPCDATFSIQSLAAAYQAPGGATAPSAGVIVGWSLRHGGLFTSGGHNAATGTMTTRLRVIRGSGSAGIGRGAGPQESLSQVAGTYSFAARLPVQAGDRIGYDLSITPSNLFLDGAEFTNGVTANVLAYSTVWPEGSSPGFYTETPDNAALLLNATLENDADGDGYGDESQDACPGNAQRQAVPCEPQPPGGGPGPGGGSTPAFGAQTLVTLKPAAGQIAAAAPVKIRVANANVFEIAGSLSGKSSVTGASSTAARTIRLRAKRFTVAAGAKKVVKLKLPSALRAVLKSRGRISIRLAARVTDPAGNTRTVKRKVTAKLKRR